MALVRCAECGHSVSNKATSCPNCGYTVSAICWNCTHFSDTCGECDCCTAPSSHDYDVWSRKSACPAFVKYEDYSDYD